MKNTNEKQALITKEAKKLFFKFGVKKVSVEEICSKCAISKKTFYNFYKNKYELIEEILNAFVIEDYKIFEDIKKEKISFREKVIKLTEKKMKKYSTAEAIFFTDVIENCKELKEYVGKVTNDGDRQFFQFVSEEQSNDNLRTDLPASFISYLLTTKTTQIIFDSEVEKMLPNFNKRVHQVVDCLINGIESDRGNSS